MKCHKCGTQDLDAKGQDQDGRDLFFCKTCSLELLRLPCNYCPEKTVYLDHMNANDIEVWVCSECKKNLHWCPECNQGWVVHKGDKVFGQMEPSCEYVCCECEMGWESLKDLGGL